MIKVSIVIERKSGLTQKQKDALAKVYGALWTEAWYDPENDKTQKFATPLAQIMQDLNKELKFKP